MADFSVLYGRLGQFRLLLSKHTSHGRLIPRARQNRFHAPSTVTVMLQATWPWFLGPESGFRPGMFCHQGRHHRETWL